MEGLIADHFASYAVEAPELEFYTAHLQSPVLDAGCGTGRLLAPLREHGFDIDGFDASADMLERCRRAAPEVTLWVSALHELDAPRRYASIVCCNAFGLGTTREQDVTALARLHDALLPGGVLILENEEREFLWRVHDWTAPSDGEIRMSARVEVADPDERFVRWTLRAETADGRREELSLTMRQWYRDELEPALCAAGFASVDVVPSPAVENALVYVARAGRS